MRRLWRKICGTDMNITNDKVTEYINKFYTPVSPEMMELREKAEQGRVPVILRETESVLAFLMKMTAPESVLEIGTAVGYSAMFFASFGAEVVTVEKDSDKAQNARANIKAMGFGERITVITGDGEEAVRGIREKKFDLVFIDAAKSHYTRFFEAALPLCADGALIISDNVLLKGTTASDEFDTTGRFKTNIKRMREYLDHISDHPSLDTVILSCGDGLALSRYKP